MLRVSMGFLAAVTITAGMPAEAAPGDTHGCACVHNSTGTKVNFRYKWGTNPWSNRSVQAGNNYHFCWRYGSGTHTSPTLLFELDVDMTKGSAWTKYDLTRIQSPGVGCSVIPSSGHYSIRFRPGTKNQFIEVVKGR